MKPNIKIVSSLILSALLSPAAAAVSVTYWQREVAIETTLLFYHTVTTDKTGEVDLILPTSPGGGSGHDFELNAGGTQTTTVTQTPNALSILGQASVASGATVTYPANMFGETTVVANCYFTVTEKAEYFLYGEFAGSGTGPNHHLKAALYGASDTTPTVAIGYFQDGTSSLPGSPLSGVLEPGDYFFSLSLWSKSIGETSFEGQVASEMFSGGVNNFAFVVQEVPEPSIAIVAAGGFLVLTSIRRRER